MNAESLTYHSVHVDELYKLLDSSATGLSSTEAKHRLQKYGPNELKSDKATSRLHIFLHQFKSTIVAILAIAAVISLYYHHYIDAGVIIGVIALNAVIGYIQEYKAEAAIAALRKLVTPTVNVYRDGQLVLIPARELVIGDVIEIEEGNSIAADGRIIASKGLATQESALTGESLPIEKYPHQLPEHTQLADRNNMVFTGTSAVRGTATAIVVATDDDTILGSIATELRSVSDTISRFDNNSTLLSKQLAGIAIVLAAITFLVGFFIRHIPFADILPFTLATLVSAIPESLPLIFMVVLTITARRMAKRNAIVRQLTAASTLGSVNVIITDKTGTLTQNQMLVEQIIDHTHPPIPVNKLPQTSTLQQLTRVASVCNRTKTITLLDHPQLQGDPTEIAYTIFGRQVNPDAVRDWEKRTDTPFDQKLKLQACLVRNVHSGKHEVWVTGAPESIMDRSTLSKPELQTLQQQIETLTSQAMRVIGFAHLPLSHQQTTLDLSKLANLKWLGAVGITDPERPEVAKSLVSAYKAGVRVIMATGDHPITATAIANRIGLKTNAQVYTGQDVESASDTQFEQMIQTCNVFARMTPESKLRLAKSLQKQGYTIAMTGDGINDAPALKGADVGISMGKVGTDVAREASDIVLVDDNFATIISAIEEGRTQLRNMRRTSFFLITTSVGISVSLLISLILGLPLPLLPKQILWLNIVGGGVTDIALATEPIHEDVLNFPPPPKNEGILNKAVIPLLIGLTLIMSIATLAVYDYFVVHSAEKARTAVFVVLSFMQLVNVFNVRSLRKSAFTLSWFSNKAVNAGIIASVVCLFAVLYLPPLAKIFDFYPLHPTEVSLLAGVSLVVLVMGESIKFLQRRTVYRNSSSVK